jgi:hypothetical protein
VRLALEVLGWREGVTAAGMRTGAMAWKVVVRSGDTGAVPPWGTLAAGAAGAGLFSDTPAAITAAPPAACVSDTPAAAALPLLGSLLSGAAAVLLRALLIGLLSCAAAAAGSSALLAALLPATLLSAASLSAASLPAALAGVLVAAWRAGTPAPVVVGLLLPWLLAPGAAVTAVPRAVWSADAAAGAAATAALALLRVQL